MAKTVWDLPPLLKQEAEQWASSQGVSLDEFIVWAVAEKVGGLRQALDDPRFPHVTFRRGASGWPMPVLRGTGIRVQTIVVAVKDWKTPAAEVAEDYGLTAEQVADALAFYEAHKGEIEAAMAEEQQLERAHV